jgi:hypothetical protein
MEMAEVYLRARDPLLCERTCTNVSDAAQQTDEGPTKARWEKFIRSEPMTLVLGKKLIQTTSTDFLAVLNHQRRMSPPMSSTYPPEPRRGFHLDCAAGQLEEGMAENSLCRRRGITFEEHQKALAGTRREDYRLFFELLWETVVLRRTLPR